MPRRSCGECTACCTVMGIEELDKPIGVPCPKLCTSGAPGCSIYATKPPSCTEFACVWLVDKQGFLFNDDDRPDKSGIMFDHSHPGSPTAQAIVDACGGRIAIAREVWPGAFNQPAGFGLVTRLSRLSVVVLVGHNGSAEKTSEMKQILGPEDLVTDINRILKSARHRTRLRTLK